MNDLTPAKLTPNGLNVQNIVFGVILVALFFLVCRLFSPFFTVFLWAIVMYVMANPLFKKITKNFTRNKTRDIALRNLFAGLFALGTGVIVIVPVLFVMSQFVKQIVELTQIARDLFYNKPTVLQDIINAIANFVTEISSGQIVLTADDIQRRVLSLLNNGVNYVLYFSKNIVFNIGSFFAGFVFMVFCLFFFYLDGQYLSNLILNLVPIRHDYLKALVNKFKEITKNLLMGYIIVALIQAVLAYIVFSIFNVKGALVFACLTFICVFIPMIGGSLVWLPLGIVRIVSGDLAGGIIFLVVSGIFISLLDNVLRPLFLQDRIQLHPLIIFFAILGGLKAFAFNGLVLGPMIVILFLTVLDMFLTEHQIEHKYTNFSGGE
ncbi:AI-2E family transporter [Spirochaetia bacterium]|nr:AI-2E family transporter [Spirochaetia bacterium]